VEERHIHGWQEIRKPCYEKLPIDLAEQVCELRLHIREPFGVAAREQITGTVALHRAQHEDDELELGRRNRERLAGDDRLEDGALHREPVDGGPVPSDDQAAVEVHVDERAIAGVVADPARRAGELGFRRRVGPLEAQARQHGVQSLRPSGIDEQVDVSGAAFPAAPLPVPLPLAVDDSGGVERLPEAIDQRRRRRRRPEIPYLERHAVIRAAPRSFMMRRASSSSGGSGKSRRPSSAVPSIQAVRTMSARSYASDARRTYTMSIASFSGNNRSA